MACWEAKVNSRRGFVTGNFAIERACYDEQMARVSKGERGVITWLEEVDGSWYANWVERLPILFTDVLGWGDRPVVLTTAGLVRPSLAAGVYTT